MSIARNQRRKKERVRTVTTQYLANLLASFYELLSTTPQPSDETVRSEFIKRDTAWKSYCNAHNLMNMSHLFTLNVKEAWERNTNR